MSFDVNQDTPIPSTEWQELTGATDHLLMLMVSPRPRLDRKTLRRLPAWRAVTIARVAARCGLLERRELDTLIREARLSGEVKPG